MVADALTRNGHTFAWPADAGVDELAGAALAKAVQVKQFDVITADRAFARYLADFGGRLKRSAVFLQLEGGEIEQDDAIDRLFIRYKRLKPGQLYTVTETRVKVQQMRSDGPRRSKDVDDENELDSESE